MHLKWKLHTLKIQFYWSALLPSPLLEHLLWVNSKHIRVVFRCKVRIGPELSAQILHIRAVDLSPPPTLPTSSRTLSMLAVRIPNGAVLHVGTLWDGPRITWISSPLLIQKPTGHGRRVAVMSLPPIVYWHNVGVLFHHLSRWSCAVWSVLPSAQPDI